MNWLLLTPGAPKPGRQPGGGQSAEAMVTVTSEARALETVLACIRNTSRSSVWMVPIGEALLTTRA
jgi:hypothetical protein